ncbi:TetR family transcriptional regulator [Sediminihabitans luteus]|uniref:TetR family transcriptional regulator n=1 Tax=Sediminihabitans luteus TaxID=1138585 RepID=A0A2M9D0M7_9CELL|nr:TetR/AcrR family transcriptional regulator [Sediminihabitans luteus]PJJ77558.1 TetR family transcriptional regulator [Sediminihabitans luteus]
MPTRAAGVRERARAQLVGEILAAARTKLAADGAADLSLRSIARDLGMASSAMYRYFPSRDALLTALVIDAYDAVGDVAEASAADARAAGAGPGPVWLAVARSYRSWALENRASFDLVYGTPVRGYDAPQDTVAPALRLWRVIASVLGEALARDELTPRATSPETRDLLRPVVLEVAGVPAGQSAPPHVADAAARSVALYAGLVGAVTTELAGHYADVTTDPSRLFDVTVQTMALGAGLAVELPAR